jgi:hypothetical protein
MNKQAANCEALQFVACGSIVDQNTKLRCGLKGKLVTV